MSVCQSVSLVSLSGVLSVIQFVCQSVCGCGGGGVEWAPLARGAMGCGSEFLLAEGD